MISENLVNVFKRGLEHKGNVAMEDALKLLEEKIAKSVIFKEKKFTGLVSGRMHMYVVGNEIVKITYVRRENNRTKQYRSQKSTRKELYDVDLKVVTEAKKMKAVSYNDLEVKECKSVNAKVKKVARTKEKVKIKPLIKECFQNISLTNGFEIEVNEYLKIKKGMSQKTDQQIMEFIEKKMENAYLHKQLKLIVKGNWHFYMNDNIINKVVVERSKYSEKWEQERCKKKSVLV